MDLSRTPTKRDAGHDQYGSDTPPQKIVQDSPQSSLSGSHPPDEQTQLASWRGYEEITNWRHCQSVEDLTKIFTLTDTAIKNLQGKLEESHSQSFLEFLVEDAEEYIDSLFRHLRSTNTQGIDYSFFPAKSTKDMDKLISVYLELMRIYRMFRGRCAGQYVELLLKIIPKPVNKKVKVSTTAVTYPAGIKLAFCQQPTSGRDTVTPLLHDICDLFNTFWNTKVEYMAPYTSLLGPSGLGKSYTVRQIAKQNLGFVVYTCLTRERSGTYPPRSIFADLLLGDDQDTDLTHIVDEDLRREVLTSLYECYVAAGLVNVRLCRKFGITPSIFYDCQVEDGFSKFQKACAEALKLLFRTVRAIHEENHVQEVKRRIRNDETGNDTGFEFDENVEIQLSALQFDHLEHVDKCIYIYEEAAEAIFSSIRKELETVAPYKALLHTVGAGLSAQEGQPAVLFCVDEVNELFRTRADDHDPLRFLALRRAFRNRSRVSPTETDKKFFALLSDTSSNVSYITPSYDRDPSAKFKRHLELLRPIYILDSLDMFAEDGRNAAGDGIDLSRLFSVGRPLWGAYIREPSLGLTSAINVAHLKAGCGRDISASSESISPMEALALFSYRMGFYVSRRELAEKLASGYLHYFVSISDDRRFIRTKAPSEPILAHASAVQTLRKPGSRSAMIAHFYSNLTNGSIHVGDIGELVATWVFLFTMDKVLDPDNYRPIDLTMFLKTLLSPSLSSSVLLHMDASPELKQLLKEGTVFFNHFSRCHDPVSQETLEYAYFRGAAILPPFGYKGADIILPIHRRGQDKFSYILVQVKNRQNDVLGDGLEKESRRSCEDAASLLGPEVPYLGILMSLRSKAGQEDAKITYPFEKTPGRETRQSNNPEGPPRVILTSLGLSEGLYPGMAFPGEAYAVAETALIVQYLRDLVECNTDMAMAKHLITFYHERLIPLRRRGHAVSGQ